ncbi:uncharacterized protein LOC116258729 [Nymphaea colorata]|nr:uncharacterized protein LOC116258729 [Nymphaea colorata]XP_031491932.1 uncharacterized protein LOC116258729 [Nymphaea colorata]XP_031491933.1 uncharacterized protein LOC116258729 [Nymphaea colorata]XP_031491935.1 uncharacterized protein LOC116258729 [Nymphaea colorata]XP_031491936.1 uncharacterized protein LOC116258729 [Nymphaea colorata]XP_049935062.1 uncharacterized protein LOC116258729 [Nymphaea colorata]
MNSRKTNGYEKEPPFEEQQRKINEIRQLVAPVSGRLAIYCTDAQILRYLRARNWNIKKAVKMLKESLKWRHSYKPEEICWDDVAHEAHTGKIYRSDFTDKSGRTVLVMRPGVQNTNSIKGQIKYLVYCMENAVLNLPPDQEQMVWLIDFKGFNLSNISVKVTKETAHVLQDHYPERLGLAILYNPPKFFESFWTVVKPFLEPKTARKVKFVYSDDLGTKKILEDLFDMEKLECAFGGQNEAGFNITQYGERMRDDDKKRLLLWNVENNSSVASSAEGISNLLIDNSQSDSSDECGEISENSSHGITSATQSSENSLLVNDVNNSCSDAEQQPKSGNGNTS